MSTATVPASVERVVGHAVERLVFVRDEIRRMRDLGRSFGSAGRYEADFFRTPLSETAQAFEMLAEFRRMAATNNVDADAFLARFDTIPTEADLAPSDDAVEWLTDSRGPRMVAA